MVYYKSNRNKENSRIKSFVLRMSKKIKAINLLGGKCEHCGEERCWLLEFHHKNPKTKEKSISKLRQSKWDSIKEEVVKCQLLCSNCHHLEHDKGQNSNRAKKLCLEYKHVASCENCNENQIELLEFHHVDPSTKKFNISGGYLFKKGWDSVEDISLRIRKELDKCQVLCSNCHNEKQFELELFEQLKAEIIKKVDEIENIQQPKKIDRNLIIELNKEGKSQKEIAEIIGCKPHTICTILKQENIEHQRMRTIDVEKIFKLKEKFGIGNGRVAKMLGYNKGSIQRAIKKYETRNRNVVG